MQDLLKRIDQTTGIWIGRARIVQSRGQKASSGHRQARHNRYGIKDKPTELSPMYTSSDVEARTCPQSRSQGICKQHSPLAMFTFRKHSVYPLRAWQHRVSRSVGALPVEGQTTASAEEHLQKLIDVARLENRIFSALPPSHWRDVIISRAFCTNDGGPILGRNE